MMKRNVHFLSLVLMFIMFASGVTAEPVDVKYSRSDLQAKWKQRVQSVLDNGKIALIDLESSLKRKDAEQYLEAALTIMDDLGVALIAFDGYQAPKTQDHQKNAGYRWGYDIHDVVNVHPDRFILGSNGGTNENWLNQKGGAPKHFIDQTEVQVRSGDYPIMGEFDFRHYLSGHQCKSGHTNRDSDIPLNGENGHRLFKLSQETGVAFVIHLEPEDAPLAALEEMLRTYPKANVIVAHFGQIRYPGKESRFGPKLVRRLLSTYPNLYYDISTGRPGRMYSCNGNVIDTVIWQDTGPRSQKETLKPAYQDILTRFSDRFVVGTDYGGGRAPLPTYLKKRIKNIRLILRDLPDQAKHNIAYRNAWKLLTGKAWGEKG